MTVLLVEGLDGGLDDGPVGPPGFQLFEGPFYKTGDTVVEDTFDVGGGVGGG